MKHVPLTEDLAALLPAGEGGTQAIEEKQWTDEDLVQLGQVLDLGPERTLALVLKRQWEESRSGAEFAPESIALFQLLERHDQLAGLDEEGVHGLAREMLLADLFHVAADSPELEQFVERSTASRDLLTNATPEQRERLWQGKHEWLELSEEQGDILMLIEQQRLAAARVNQQFMSQCGEAFVELQEQADRVRSLQARLEFKQADPGLTRGQLAEMVAEQEVAARDELEQLKLLAVCLPTTELPEGLGTLSVEDVAEYDRECKAALRRIWFLLHPDRLKKHPSYDQLTEKQMEQIGALWNRVLRIRDGELACHPQQIGYRRRTLEVLLQAEREAIAILEAAGVDTDIHLVVQGATIEQQIEWYEQEVQRLEADITAARAELKAILDDPAVRERRAILAMSARQLEKIIEQMRAKAGQYREQAEALDARLDDAFKED